MIDRVETGLFMRQSGPCVICGDTNYALSCGGPTICPKCDCGQFDAATVEKQARVIADLRAQLAKSCDNGRFEDSDWVCPRAAKAEAALATGPAATPALDREQIARIIFGQACGISRWDDEFYTEERNGCLETADALVTALSAQCTFDKCGDWPTDGAMLKILEQAGFDTQQTHPGCYYAFSWKTFTEKLRALVSRPHQSSTEDKG